MLIVVLPISRNVSRRYQFRSSILSIIHQSFSDIEGVCIFAFKRDYVHYSFRNTNSLYHKTGTDNQQF